jgi:fumarate hydratase class II
MPADGHSSSIMPGKTSPTHCEALMMATTQVTSNHVTVTIAGTQGQMELNVFKPIIIHNVLQSCRLLGDSAVGFARHIVEPLEPNRGHIALNLAGSLMLVTALNPRIGYDKVVKVGKLVLAENITLKQAAEKLGHSRPENFDRRAVPAEMTRPGVTLPGGGD